MGLKGLRAALHWRAGHSDPSLATIRTRSKPHPIASEPISATRRRQTRRGGALREPLLHIRHPYADRDRHGTVVGAARSTLETSYPRAL